MDFSLYRQMDFNVPVQKFIARVFFLETTIIFRYAEEVLSAYFLFPHTE